MRISKVKPDSGSISTRSYAFVFSDNLEDWIKSNKVNNAAYMKRAYNKTKRKELTSEI